MTTLEIKQDIGVKVIFHGYLKKLCPEGIFMTGKTALEILQGVSNQVKSLRPALGEQRHHISVKGYESVESLSCPINPNDTELHVFPTMSGAKGGLFKIIIGVALIAVSFYMPAAGLLGGMVTASSVFSFGASLILGGLLEMVSASPKIDRNGDSASDPEASKYISAAKNTTKIGTRIPLAYGLNRVGGHYLSFDIQAKDVSA